MMTRRKKGIFTIASKNYISYVRVLFKSVAEFHPDYSLYLCLTDEADRSFDVERETFEIVQSDRLNIPCFQDMALRYDIMEFNTAVKPFMFSWLFDNTDLDSVIYLDPDIKVYSRFDRLEDVLAADTSVVLTPHLSRPVEDGRIPNDYTILQSGVFNLGFAALNRCSEARQFVSWWGRRLETQACVDFARNLFTDQRWCDLAPCFLDHLCVFKAPGYNAAYWNLSERVLRKNRGKWFANDEPLAFFHFSGIVVQDASIISKHQDRFGWDHLRRCKALFDDYRESVLGEGWEQSHNLPYSYAITKEGMPIPTVVRHLYRETHPSPQDFKITSVTATLLLLCNAISNAVPDSRTKITRLMEFIHRNRPDLQPVFNLNTEGGRTNFAAWYTTAGRQEYNLPQHLILDGSAAKSENSPAYGAYLNSAESSYEASLRPAVAEAESSSHDQFERMDAIWDRLPSGTKRKLAPLVRRMLNLAGSSEFTLATKIPESEPQKLTDQENHEGM